MSLHNGKLLPYRQSLLTQKTTALIVIVPGIGTDPVPAWKAGSLAETLAFAAKLVTGDTTYTAWWDHGMPTSYALSFQNLHESAKALWANIQAVFEKLHNSHCPVFFVGHSTGGTIVKEALRCWGQSTSEPGARSCVAGVILLGTPHTAIRKRAEEYCRVIGLTFATQANPSASEYAKRLMNSCQGFQTLKFPTVSVYELKRTRLRGLEIKYIVEKELTRIGTTNEVMWPAHDTLHKNLCHLKVDLPFYHALWQFFHKYYYEKSKALRPKLPKKSSVNIDRESLPPSINQDAPWFEESPVESPTSSQPTSYSSKAIPIRQQSETSIPEMSLPIQTEGSRIEYNIPAKAVFVSRDHILAQVEDILQQADPWQDPMPKTEEIRAFGLCGSRGSGKTACAVHFVHKHQHNYDSLLWIKADSTSRLSDEYSKIAGKLGLVDEAKAVDKFEVQRLVKDWFEDKSNQRRSKWLIIFDGVLRPRDLKHFWPQHGHGDVLITGSCSVKDLTDFTGQFGTEVRPFGMDVAHTFLKQLNPEQLLQDPAQLLQATRIAEMLGGLPLALVTLSDLVKQQKVDDDLVRKISRRRDSRWSSMSSEMTRRDLTEEPLDCLRLILDTKLEELASGSKSLMELIAVLDPDDIQQSILRRGITLDILHDYPSTDDHYGFAIEDLLKRSLITKDLQTDDITCNSMIAEVVNDRMSPERREFVFETAVTILYNHWPSMSMEQRHNTQRWDIVNRLLHHVRKLQQLCETDQIELVRKPNTGILFATLLNHAGWCMYERGDYEDARLFAEYARQIAFIIDIDGQGVNRHDLLDLRSQVAYSLGAIAIITHGKSESLEMHSEMLVLRKRIRLEHGNGRRDAFLAHSYNELGTDFMADDEYEIAEGFYRRSIRLYQSIQDWDPDWLILPSVNLGLAFWLQGRHSDAEAIIKPVLEEQECRLGPDGGATMKTGRILHALGNVTLSLGRKDESFNYHRRALQHFEKTVGPNHNRSCDVMYRVADHHARNKNYEAAIEIIDRALVALNTRPLFEREMARFYFKRADVMKRTREFSSPSQYQIYEKMAAATYFKYRPKQKPASELTEENYNDLVLFWSR